MHKLVIAGAVLAALVVVNRQAKTGSSPQRPTVVQSPQRPGGCGCRS